MSKGKKVTIGYWYSIGWHSILCQGGADAILKIRYADRDAWVGNVTTNQTVYINNPNLLGGEKREGGLQGNVDFMFGGEDQQVNPYLALHSNRTIIPNYFGSFSDSGFISGFIRMLANLGLTANQATTQNGGMPVPAYRGVVSLVFKSFTFAAMNPYMKNMAVTVRRVPKSLGADYSAITLHGRKHANPSHMIYDVLTNGTWGLGYGIDDVDVTTFTTAAFRLFSEGFGLSVAWTNETTAEDFINLILRHINATLYPAPDTGKYTLKLIRDDYEVDDLPTLDPSNIISLKSFQRAAPTDLTNEVSVQYFDPDQSKTAKVTLQNLASIKAVGRIIRQVIDLPAIRDGALAARVAQREVQTLSTPLASAQIEVNLTTWSWARPGAVFKLNWPKLGITQLICRISDVEYGELRSGRIVLNVIEDVFGLPETSYVVNDPPTWTPVPNDLGDITTYRLLEWPYYLLIQNFGEDYATSLVDERNFTGAIAARSNGTWTGFQVHELVAGSYRYNMSNSFSPWVGVTNAITKQPTDNVWSYEFFYSDDEIEVGSIGVIDDEWVQVTAINHTTMSVTVLRAIFDSVPATHIAGSRIWFNLLDTEFDDSTTRFEGETVTYKLLPEAGSEVLPLATATPRSLTLRGRQERPYPPGNVKFNGEYFPANVSEELNLTWAFRDRTQQTAAPTNWTAGNIGPEVGTTTTVKVYRSADNALLHTGSAIALTTYSVGSAQIGDETNIRIDVLSVRAALESYQIVSHTMNRLVSGDPYSAMVLSDAPLGYWRLGESTGATVANDSSGNARHGTTVSSVTFQQTALTVTSSLNKAARFDGGGYVGVPYVAALAPSAALTVETWMQVFTKPTSTAINSVISKTETGGYNMQFAATASRFEFLVYVNGAYLSAGVAMSTINLNETYHCVGTYDGRYARLYIDGALVATADAGATYPITYSNNNSLMIGADPGSGALPVSGQFFNGYIDEVSVYGIAISATAAAARYKLGRGLVSYREDPFFDKVALAMHMDGANGSTTFTDVKGKVVTPNGNAQISTTQSKFGGASALFDGAGDYLQLAQSTDFDMTSDFTFECWVRPTTFSNSRAIVSKYNNSSNGFVVQCGTSGTVAFFVGTTSGYQLVQSSVSLVINTWSHIACTMRGKTMRVFINGVLSGTSTYTGTIGVISAPLYIGRDPLDTSRDFSGNIDDVRITRVCRYTKTFVLSPEANPDRNVCPDTEDPFFTETALLLHMNGANASTTFTDVKGKTVTPSGNAQISTAQSRFGGASALLDGTGDFLSVADSADFSIVGDFTVEAWIRPAVLGGNRYIVRKGTSSSYNQGFGLCLGAALDGSIFFYIGNGSAQSVTTSAAVAVNAWSHVAATKQGNTLRIFINGTLSATGTYSGTGQDVAQDLTIGRDTNVPARDFNGYIDDVRITRAARYVDSFTPPKIAHPDVVMS
jgi:hypothetical protein